MPLLLRRRRRELRSFFSFAATNIAVFAVLVAAAGVAYETIASWNDSQRFPQRGRSVDVGGYKLNLNCTGEGSPTVVLESGVGGPGLIWALVQPRVAEFTRVCSYDRAGYGWSDVGPMPRTSGRMADELHTLLKNGGIEPPYILVGHSFGGFEVRIFAARHPEEVSGVVLVDASHENQETEGFRPAPNPLRPLAPLLLRIGVLRATFYFQGARKLPSDLHSELEYLMLQAKAIETAYAEIGGFPQSASEVRAAGKLGDKPLIVLTGAKPGSRSPQLHRRWLDDLQPRLLRLSSHSRQMFAENSGHNVPVEEPSAVVRAIRAVYGTVE
ncbi:MAG: alpha/beta fold hydrolase [Terriglobales bacterium]